MTFPPSRSIRLQLTLWYAGVVVLVLVAFALAVYVFVVQSVESGIDDVLQSYGAQVQHTAASHTKGHYLNVGSVPMPTFSAEDSVSGLLLMNLQGKSVGVANGHLQNRDLPLRLAISTGKENCGTLTEHVAATGRTEPVRYCVKLVRAHGKPVGGIEVVSSLAEADRALDNVRLALFFGLPIALLLTVLGGWLLAGRALEPVEEITSAARSISATDLSRRINLGRQDELGRLAGTFDEMIGRLEQAFHEQRRLAADVSHELRSPLAIVEAQVSLALRRARAAGDYRAALENVQEEVDHMSAMVNQLLLLARADAGEEPVAREEIDLAAQVRAVVELVEPLAADKGLTLRMEARETILVNGDAGRLRQLLLNLLTNAFAHTPAGGIVTVTLAAEDERAVLTVGDNGEGIAADDLPHIFERFYRADRARRRDAGNSGLGLSIVSWIVEAHGGTIDVASAPGQGTTFTVGLPRTTATVGAA